MLLGFSKKGENQRTTEKSLGKEYSSKQHNPQMALALESSIEDKSCHLYVDLASLDPPPHKYALQDISKKLLTTILHVISLPYTVDFIMILYLISLYICIIVHSWGKLPPVEISLPSSANTTTSNSTQRNSCNYCTRNTGNTYHRNNKRKTHSFDILMEGQKMEGDDPT